ncbi:hypothetical protein [Flavobacterium subsaxonicum]|uniref:Response regulatory domain-containing protein n=1 Tax=Flavobacterium subsaxonicum WB 4.1-42 = DSM 21790 TaxID=1121898 RepID=A0A0A2MFV8_9FLAO|nr:hypothetical protein [Flavobacterium subsaxonicum]KGO91577.1 hypothetical protein Q766_17050 [Flavobacterium subsaxonicum WB 4.1-42 = DSM 21790]
MNKDGTIVVLEADNDNRDFICQQIKALRYKNDVMCFSSSDEAGTYMRNNILDVFILLQSTNAPGIEVPDTRNMVYMHEKFKTDVLPYIFLVLTKSRTQLNSLHTFVHAYYKPDTEVNELANVLKGVIDFWKDHVFPPKVSPFSGN